VFYKILSKSISITKYILKCISITFNKNTKCKLLLTKVIEIQNTFRSSCESINEYSFNNRDNNNNNLGIGAVNVTVQCTLNKRNTENIG